MVGGQSVFTEECATGVKRVEGPPYAAMENCDIHAAIAVERRFASMEPSDIGVCHAAAPHCACMDGGGTRAKNAAAHLFASTTLSGAPARSARELVDANMAVCARSASHAAAGGYAYTIRADRPVSYAAGVHYASMLNGATGARNVNVAEQHMQGSLENTCVLLLNHSSGMIQASYSRICSVG